MHFEKITFEQFKQDASYLKLENDQLLESYRQLLIPKRATSGSAGYDFHIPFPLQMKAGVEYLIPTGIRCIMPQDYVLLIFPRSSLGFKYGLKLNNTVGVIDSDYQFSVNSGHILIKVSTEKDCELDFNDRFVQGVFLPYGITDDDDSVEKRTGGIGSSGT